MMSTGLEPGTISDARMMVIHVWSSANHKRLFSFSGWSAGVRSFFVRGQQRLAIIDKPLQG
jgi:hypothetical protein